MSATATKNAITLKGSAAIITEYLKYGINSILFQRGIYPAESFQSEQQYGITILMSQDDKIKKFLQNVLGKLEEWLTNDSVEKISMIITNVTSKEVIECWDFKVKSDNTPDGSDPKNPTSDKELKKIQAEIRDVMRQIAATVSYLPLLEHTCSFDVLVHVVADAAIEAPTMWSETEEVEIKNAQTVQLKSFSTGLQKVETVVNYKMNE